MNRCIWCLQTDQKPSREHIVPEVLGCPSDWILSNGEVCELCNNRLGFLDRVLADEFDLLRLHVGQVGKRGKPPKITGRPNLRGERRPYGPDILVNMGRKIANHPHYGVIRPPTGNPRDVQADFSVDGSIARIRIRVQVGATKEFARAIHKIAFTWLAKAQGPGVAWRKTFSAVRDFVLCATGTRYVLGKPARQSEYHRAGTVYSWGDGCSCVEFTICGNSFMVDLSPRQQVLPVLVGEMSRTHGRNGWGILPPPKPDHELFKALARED